jgi:hypothetical protein
MKKKPVVAPKYSKEKALEVTAPIEHEAIREAIALRLQGYSWRGIAEKLDQREIRGPRGGKLTGNDLFNRCRPYEKMIQNDEGFKSLKNSTLSVAMEAVAQVGEALAAGEIPKQSLPVVMGISVDKYARLEAVEREPINQSNPMLAMLAKLTESGGTLKLEVTQPKTVDVEVIK